MVKHSRRRRARPALRDPIRPLLRCRARPARGDARRVLSAFLKLRCEGGKPMEKVFDASHLERMLRSGQLEDAFYYLHLFLRRVPEKDSSPLSWRLLCLVGLFKILATVAAGGKDGAALAALYQNTRVPSNASSRSLVLDTQIEQNAPEPIILGEQPTENLERAPEKQEVVQV